MVLPSGVSGAGSCAFRRAIWYKMKPPRKRACRMNPDIPAARRRGRHEHAALPDRHRAGTAPEGNCGKPVRFRASGLRSRAPRAASGHLYFTLKDDRNTPTVSLKDRCRLACRSRKRGSGCCHRQADNLWRRLEYQIVVQTMEMAGEGAMLRQLESPPAAAEGLFDADERRSLCLRSLVWSPARPAR